MTDSQRTLRDIVEAFRRSDHAEPLTDIASAIKTVPLAARAELLIRLLAVHREQFRETQNALEPTTVASAFPEFAKEINQFYAGALDSHSPAVGNDGVAQSLDTIAANPTNPSTGYDEAKSPNLIGGRYRIQKVLGEGTFGIVYLAFDETLKRPVALKLSKSWQSESTVVEFNSFLEESRILSALEHPRILPVLDAGVSGDGRQFFVSKYLSGGTLQDRIAKQGLFPIPLSLEIIRDIANALQHAHQHGLYHRDVKLANIIFDDVGNPFLADFGLALREAERQERAGKLSGSPAFMAPEQVKASSTIIDGRTDIWALGVVLYFLLTKQFPFTGTEANAVFHDILEREPQPPRQINPKVSLPLERLTLRCLEKDISKRFGSAAELSDELSVLIDGDRETSSQSLVGKYEPDNRDAVGKSARSIIGAASLVSVTALAVIGVMAWLNRPTGSRTGMKQVADSQRDIVADPSNPSTSDGSAAVSQAEATVNQVAETLDQPPNSVPFIQTTMDASESKMADIEDLIDKAISEKATDFTRPLDRLDSPQISATAATASDVTTTNSEEELLVEKPAGIFTEAMRMPATTAPVFDRRPGETAISSSLPEEAPGHATVVSDEDENDLHGWTQLIDEDFSSVHPGSIPEGWQDLAGLVRVAEKEDRSCLVMPEDGMATIDLPSAELGNQFELEFAFSLPGGQLTSSLFQVDMICPGQPTVTAGVTIKGGKRMVSVLGADRKMSPSGEYVQGKTSRLRLAYEDGTLKIFLNDQFCHKLDADFKMTSIRLGLTKYAKILAVRLHSRPNELAMQTASNAADWKSLFDETFSAILPGDLPPGWTTNNEMARVQKDGADSFLSSPSPSIVTIPIGDSTKEDFLLEMEIHIPGGYTKTPTFVLAIDSPRKISTEIGCYIYASSFAIRTLGGVQDSLRKPWTEYMNDRDARLRISRSKGTLHIYVGDELFSSTRCEHAVSEIRLRLDKNVRMHRLRVDRRL